MNTKGRRSDGTFDGSVPGPGLPKGYTPKATRDVREAVALIAQGNVDKVQGWLDRVAKEDPGRALDLYVKLLEYHIPKLARSELTGKDGEALRASLVISNA
jgi:hypothetical protein